jgi:TolB-like protein
MAAAALPLPALAVEQAPANPPPAQVRVETRGKILILPFAQVNPNDPRPWLGKSIQQSVAADLILSSPDRVIGTDEAATTIDQAVAIGRRMGARYVVMGSFISSDPDLRITGQVIDVETAQPISGLKVTGNPGQIFHMEDGLAMQVKSRLMPEVLQQQFAQQQAAQQNVAPPTQPIERDGQYTGVRTDGNEAPQSYYSNYAYPVASDPAYYDRYYYSTPPAYYYGGPDYYGYPYAFSPFFGFGIVSNFGFRDHHGFDHHFGGGFDHDGHGFHDGRGFNGRSSIGGSSLAFRNVGSAAGFGQGRTFTRGFQSGPMVTSRGFPSQGFAGSRGPAFRSGFSGMSGGGMMRGGSFGGGGARGGAGGHR